MKCERCNKNEASVFFREIINGHETKLNLCPSCLREKEEESGLSFKGLFSNSLFTAPSIYKVREEKKCPLCAMTEREIRAAGKVGCPECYEAFADFLAPTLRRLHGSSVHRGRKPAKLAKLTEKTRSENELSRLEGELRDCLQREDYERAAVLRDTIRDLRQKGE